MEAFETFKAFWIEYGNDILTWTFTAVSYFLVFFYRHKINGTKTALDVVFKENTSKLISSNDVLSKDVNFKYKTMCAAVDEARKLYETAVGQYKELSMQIDKTQKALMFIIESAGGDGDGDKELSYDRDDRKKPDED